MMRLYNFKDKKKKKMMDFRKEKTMNNIFLKIKVKMNNI